MIISSRTPDGSPHQCPICRKNVRVEPSNPAGDAPCPNCGHLLRWFRVHLADKLGVNPDQVTPGNSLIEDFLADSLDMVELVLELEEEFGIQIPDGEAEKIQTVGDAIRYISEHHGDDWIWEHEVE